MEEDKSEVISMVLKKMNKKCTRKKQCHVYMAYLTILISILFRHVFGQFSEKFVRMLRIGRQNEDDNCKDVLRAENLAASQIERSKN